LAAGGNMAIQKYAQTSALPQSRRKTSAPGTQTLTVAGLWYWWTIAPRAWVEALSFVTSWQVMQAAGFGPPCTQNKPGFERVAAAPVLARLLGNRQHLRAGDLRE